MSTPAFDIMAHLEKTKVRLAGEAKKWVAYLDGIESKEEREKELTRKLLETYLEGRSTL